MNWLKIVAYTWIHRFLGLRFEGLEDELDEEDDSDEVDEKD